MQRILPLGGSRARALRQRSWNVHPPETVRTLPTCVVIPTEWLIGRGARKVSWKFRGSEPIFFFGVGGSLQRITSPGLWISLLYYHVLGRLGSGSLLWLGRVGLIRCFFTQLFNLKIFGESSLLDHTSIMEILKHIFRTIELVYRTPCWKLPTAQGQGRRVFIILTNQKYISRLGQHHERFLGICPRS